MSQETSFLDRELSWYPSAKDKSPSKSVTVREFCGIVGKQEFAAQVARVRAAVTEDEKRKAKINLPAVQLSGAVISGDRAQAIQQNRFTHSGILQLDVDADGLNGKTADEAKQLLATDPHVVSAFITPSGEGAKALFRITPCLTDEEHKTIFRVVEKYIWETHGLAIDPATKDSARLCFVPADGEPSWNPQAVEFVPPTNPEPLPVSTTPKASSRTFPEPPENGIHTWLPKAAWQCRFRACMLWYGPACCAGASTASRPGARIRSPGR